MLVKENLQSRTTYTIKCINCYRRKVKTCLVVIKAFILDTSSNIWDEQSHIQDDKGSCIDMEPKLNQIMFHLGERLVLVSLGAVGPAGAVGYLGAV